MEQKIKKELENIKVYSPLEKKVINLNLLQEAKDKFLLLYGFPKMGTSVCSLEHKQLSQMHDKFKQNNTLVVGYSYGKEQDIVKACPSYLNHYQIIDDTGDFIKTMGSKSENEMSDRHTFLFNPNLDLVYTTQQEMLKTRNWNEVLNKIVSLQK